MCYLEIKDWTLCTMKHSYVCRTTYLPLPAVAYCAFQNSNPRGWWALGNSVGSLPADCSGRERNQQAFFQARPGASASGTKMELECLILNDNLDIVGISETW